MERKMCSAFLLLAVVSLALPVFALPAEEAQPHEDCPLGTPRSGEWKLSAGSMQVAGFLTFGGGSTTMTVEVSDCGAKIVANGKGIGEVTFTPTNKEPPIKNSIRLDNWMTPAHDFELGSKEAELLRDPVLFVFPELATDDPKLIRPIDRVPGLLLFQTGHYRAQFRKNVGWYLDAITSYHMVSITTSEGVDAPPHTQYHFWRWTEALGA